MKLSSKRIHDNIYSFQNEPVRAWFDCPIVQYRLTVRLPFTTKWSGEYSDIFQRSTRSEDRVTYLNLKVNPCLWRPFSRYFDVYYLT